MEGSAFVIDIGYPMNTQLLTNLTKAVEDVLVLACTISSKIDYFGLSLISSAVQHVVKCSSLTRCRSNILTSIKSVNKYVKFNAKLPLTEFKDVLNLAVSEILHDFRSPSRHEASHVFPLPQPHPLPMRMTISVVSLRGGPFIASMLESVSSAYANHAGHCESIAFQVIELCSESSLTPAARCLGSVRLDAVIIGPDGNPSPRLEAVLKRLWLSPDAASGSGLIPVELVIPARNQVSLPVSTHSTLQCDAQPYLLDAACLPVADRFLLTPPSSALERGLRGPGCREGKGDGVRLRVVARLQADGLCEGSLFGMPFRLTGSPPAAFRWDLEEHRNNSHMFWALCKELSLHDEYLVAKMQHTDVDPLGGHFILIPGDRCMLLKSVASAELLMPPVPPPPAGSPSAGLEVREEDEAHRVAQGSVHDSLTALPRVDHYRADRFSSGLYRALALSARFPTRSSQTQLTPSTGTKRQRTVGSPALARAPAPAPAHGALLARRQAEHSTEDAQGEGGREGPQGEACDAAQVSDAEDKLGVCGDTRDARIRITAVGRPAEVLSAKLQEHESASSNGSGDDCYLPVPDGGGGGYTPTGTRRELSTLTLSPSPSCGAHSAAAPAAAAAAGEESARRAQVECAGPGSLCSVTADVEAAPAPAAPAVATVQQRAEFGDLHSLHLQRRSTPWPQGLAGRAGGGGGGVKRRVQSTAASAP